jgi:hypothetical protein
MCLTDRLIAGLAKYANRLSVRSNSGGLWEESFGWMAAGLNETQRKEGGIA